MSVTERTRCHYSALLWSQRISCSLISPISFITLSPLPFLTSPFLSPPLCLFLYSSQMNSLLSSSFSDLLLFFPPPSSSGLPFSFPSPFSSSPPLFPSCALYSIPYHRWVFSSALSFFSTVPLRPFLPFPFLSSPFHSPVHLPQPTHGQQATVEKTLGQRKIVQLCKEPQLLWLEWGNFL